MSSLLGQDSKTGNNMLSMHDALMRNRRHRASPDLDVWFNPSSRAPSPQPHFSFPVSGTSSPYQASTGNSPYFDCKSSPMVVTDSSSSASPLKGSPSAGSGLGLNWRDASLAAARRQREDKQTARKRNFMIGGGSLLAVTILFLLLRGSSEKVPARQRRSDYNRVQASSMSALAPLFSSAGRQHATVSFREQLSSDMSYITSPQHGDFAEQIMNFYHLTHLASVLSRIPLISPFALPASDSDSAPLTIPFSSIFDMPRFTEQTNVYAVDWNEIRPSKSSKDHLGCWIGMTGKDEMRERALAMKQNGVDASFFPLRTAPTESAAGAGDQVLAAHNFLASFEKDVSAQAGLVEQAQHVKSVSTFTSSTHTAPETHVLCMDHTLYRPEHPTTAHSTSHLDPRDHTAFHTHGKALHYISELQDAALDLAAFTLGNRSPFIVLHIDAVAQAAECALRHEDEIASAECAVPKLQSYIDAVERVRAIATRSNNGSKKLSRDQRHQARALPVIVSTDVSDIAFRGEIAAAGWTLLDFDDLELKQRFGQWPAEVLEGVVQSKATAFVGTRGSSLSTLSALRVREWRSGPTELVF